MKKKLAIVGAEQSTRDNAPWDDEEFDILVISNWANASWAKRKDIVIEIHDPELYEKHPKDPAYYQWLLQEKHATVYMKRQDVKVPASKPFPLEDVFGLTGNLKVNGNDAKIINSSIAFGMALGILLGYEQIDVYGAEMAQSSEYRSQQPIFAFWVGYAAGKGIKLNINCSERLFVQPIYGYEDQFGGEKLQGYIDGLSQQKSEIDKQALMLEGALALVRQMRDE